jgi:outer membrane biosynthesis protein TonB
VVGVASSRTTEREEERRFNIRTLAIASVASATAAVVTSQLWTAGTWIAAATTPVLVALISEALYRPTERIAERFTSDRPALLGGEREGRTPEAEPAAGQQPPTPPAREPPPARTPAEPGPGPIRVYRSTTPSPRRRRIAVGAVLATGALALVIAVFALTVPELIAGGAIGKDNRGTTFFSRDRDRSPSTEDKKKTPAGDTERQRQPTEQTTEDTTEEPTTTETPTEQPPPTAPTAEEPAPAESAPTPAPSEQP